MTKTQWMFEYISLREREKEQTDKIVEVIEIFRSILINLLGLNLLSDEDEKESIVPLSIMTGRREVVEQIFKSIDDKKIAEEAMADEEFEKLSKAIASGEDLGDMSPLFDDLPEHLDDNKEWFTPQRIKELQSVGVIIDDNINKNVQNFNIDTDRIKHAKLEKKLNVERAKQDVKHQLEQERKIKVTLDD